MKGTLFFTQCEMNGYFLLLINHSIFLLSLDTFYIQDKYLPGSHGQYRKEYR